MRWTKAAISLQQVGQRAVGHQRQGEVARRRLVGLVDGGPVAGELGLAQRLLLPGDQALGEGARGRRGRRRRGRRARRRRWSAAAGRRRRAPGAPLRCERPAGLDPVALQRRPFRRPCRSARRAARARPRRACGRGWRWPAARAASRPGGAACGDGRRRRRGRRCRHRSRHRCATAGGRSDRRPVSSTALAAIGALSCWKRATARRAIGLGEPAQQRIDRPAVGREAGAARAGGGAAEHARDRPPRGRRRGRRCDRPGNAPAARPARGAASARASLASAVEGGGTGFELGAESCAPGSRGGPASSSAAKSAGRPLSAAQAVGQQRSPAGSCCRALDLVHEVVAGGAVAPPVGAAGSRRAAGSSRPRRYRAGLSAARAASGNSRRDRSGRRHGRCAGRRRCPRHAGAAAGHGRPRRPPAPPCAGRPAR